MGEKYGQIVCDKINGELYDVFLRLQIEGSCETESSEKNKFSEEIYPCESVYYFSCIGFRFPIFKKESRHRVENDDCRVRTPTTTPRPTTTTVPPIEIHGCNCETHLFNGTMSKQNYLNVEIANFINFNDLCELTTINDCVNACENKVHTRNACSY